MCCWPRTHEYRLLLSYTVQAFHKIIFIRQQNGWQQTHLLQNTSWKQKTVHCRAYHIYSCIFTTLTNMTSKVINRQWLSHFFTFFSSLLTVLLSQPFLSALLRFSLASLGLNRFSSFNCGRQGCGLVVPVKMISFTIHDGEQGWRGESSGRSFLFIAGGGGGGGISSSNMDDDNCCLGGE